MTKVTFFMLPGESLPTPSTSDMKVQPVSTMVDVRDQGTVLASSAGVPWKVLAISHAKNDCWSPWPFRFPFSKQNTITWVSIRFNGSPYTINRISDFLPDYLIQTFIFKSIKSQKNSK